MSAIEYLNPEKIMVRRNPQGRIVLTNEGQETQISRIVRSFP